MTQLSDKDASPAGTFQQYAPDLQRLLLRVIRHTHDAEDLRQEIFARVSRIPDAQLARDPKAYLFGVAFHVIHEFRMRERRSRVIFDSETLQQSLATPAELESDELADRLNLQQQLERALDQLLPQERAVLLVVKRDGMSYEEAAAATGFSVHQVERYITSARTKLKSMLWER